MKNKITLSSEKDGVVPSDIRDRHYTMKLHEIILQRAYVNTLFSNQPTNNERVYLLDDTAMA